MSNGPITDLAQPGQLMSAQTVQAMREEVAQLFGRGKSTGFPGAQPVSFSREHLNKLKEEDYYMCEKSDGIRYLMWLTQDPNGQEAVLLIDRKNQYWFINNPALHFPLEHDRQGFHTGTIIDGELVMDTTADGKTQPTFLVFDCPVLDGRLLDRTLDKRLGLFRQKIIAPHDRLYKEFPQELPFQPFRIAMKDMQMPYGIAMMFDEIIPKLQHGNDGVIFTCRLSPYKSGTDPKIVKWKPPEENSIDCRLRLEFNMLEPNATERAAGIQEPFPDYASMPKFSIYTFQGNGREKYKYFDELYILPEEFETLKGLGDPLDDRIVECYQDEKHRWRLMRFRDDKSEANHISTVDSVLESIKDRVTEQDLREASSVIRSAWKERNR